MIYNNGVAETAETADDFTNPTWGTYFWVGSDNGGISNFYGTIKKIAFFDQALGAGDQADLHNYNDWDWLFGTKDVQGFAQQATIGQSVITLKEDVNK